MSISFFGFTLEKTKPGAISPEPIWVVWHDGYLYENETLIGCLLLTIKEFKSDRHMIG